MATRLTSEEQRNVKAVEEWARSWSIDAGKMVDELYADSTEVLVPLQGIWWVRHGKSKSNWHDVEAANQQLYRSRKMTLKKVIPHGDTVAVEVLVTETNLIDKTRERWFAAFLQFDKAGRIISDHTYDLHPEVTPDPARAHTPEIRKRMEVMQAAHQKIMAEQ